ncbi:hypothetical protein DFH11DRAFT_1808521 [Phellopilus nigrolimitatus]|nr:hypothetical protein DFH11DRAFT_1808521 [Phellopilus nigrolimitatus]
MAFLRNTYTLIDLGNFVEGSSKDAQNPFVQMLSVTNAHADFVKRRVAATRPCCAGTAFPESAEEKKAHLAEKVLSRWPYILLGSLVLFFGLVGLCVWRCCCRKRIAARKQAKKEHGKDGVGGAMKRLSVSALQMGPLKTASSYHPIEEPAPLPSSSSHPPSYHSEFHHA